MFLRFRVGRPLAPMLLAVCALSLPLGGCGALALPPEDGPTPAESPTATQPGGDEEAASMGWPAEALRPGDIVRLRIWREPEMSGDFTVNENGDAVLPRLGNVAVAGEPPEQVKQRISTGYARYLQNPTVDVVFLRRVQVLGAVRNPGLYPVDPTMTVSDALALAGGATTEGNPRRIVLVRDGERMPVTLLASTPLSEAALRSGDQIYVEQRSWLSRNTGVVTAAITGVVSLIIAFGSR